MDVADAAEIADPVAGDGTVLTPGGTGNGQDLNGDWVLQDLNGAGRAARDPPGREEIVPGTRARPREPSLAGTRSIGPVWADEITVSRSFKADALLLALGLLLFFVAVTMLWHSAGLHRLAAASFKGPTSIHPLLGACGGLAVTGLWLAATLRADPLMDCLERSDPVYLLQYCAGWLAPGLLLGSIAPAFLALLQYSTASMLFRQRVLEEGKILVGGPLTLPIIGAALSIVASTLAIVRIVASS